MAATTPAPSPLQVVRSPADVLRAVVALAILIGFLLVNVFFGASVVGFISDLLRGFDALSEEFVTAFTVLVRVACVIAVALLVVRSLIVSRWRVLPGLALAASIGAVVGTVVDGVIDEQRAPVLQQVDDVAWLLTSSEFPSTIGMAVVAALVTVGSVWVPRDLRRFGWAMVLLLTVVHFLAAPASGDAVGALLSGWTVGAIVVAALGGPVSRPTTGAVMNGLLAVGVGLADLQPAAVDARGSTPYFGSTTDGTRLFVKVLGRDERDADLLFRIYRYALHRKLGDERPFSSLRRAVEHEVLLSLAVHDMGVHTPRIAGFATVEPSAFVLAYEAVEGKSLDRVTHDQVTDRVLDQLWNQLAMLREHRVAHRDLRLANLFLDDAGTVWMIDFGFAELSAADRLLATDVAEVLASVSTKLGADRVVTSALGALGSDVIETAVPRLHTRYLSGATKTAVKEQPQVLDEIKARIPQPNPAAPVTP